MVLAVSSLLAFSMNTMSASNVLNNLLVKALLRYAHIFSAGLSSGIYGGKKMNAMFSEMISTFPLWKEPLSSTIILNSSRFCFANSFKYF